MSSQCHRDVQVHTHVISSIVHLVHKYANDSEPWPIQIEDHDGRLHEVNLQEGQVREVGTRGTVPTLMMRDMHHTCTSVLCHRLHAYVLGRCLYAPADAV